MFVGSNVSSSRVFSSNNLFTCLLVGATILSEPISRQVGGPSPAVLLAVTLAATLSSVVGFAFSAICGAILFHLAGDPVQAVETMMIASIANQVGLVWFLRRSIDWPTLTVLLSGGALGLPVGIWLLLHADLHVYTRILGVFLILYSVYLMLRRPIVLRQPHALFDVLAGLLGGITGGAVAFPGAFVTIWCGMKGHTKERQRAVFQPFILFMQVAALLTLSCIGSSHTGPGLDASDILCVPGSLLGTAVGLLLYRSLSDHHYARAINLLLIVSGASYLM